MMEEVLRALNQIVADGIIRTYAIGGAIGASFYVDAMQTEDVDAFVFLPTAATGLVTLAPIYEALQKHGGIIEREYIRFGTWPLQILPQSTPLVVEALQDAEETLFEDVPTRVFRAEHLCAIALETGRSKDFQRVRLFLERDAVSKGALKAVVERFGLQRQLEKVEATFDAGN